MNAEKTPIANGEIYRIWFASDPTGRSYIGQTRQAGGSYERVMQHITDAQNGKPSCPLLDAATVTYGIDDLRWQVLDGGYRTQEDLDEAERFYIKYFNSKNEGFNVKPGGQGQGNGDSINNTTRRLFKRIFARGVNRVTWRTVGASAYDLRDIGKIIQNFLKRN